MESRRFDMLAKSLATRLSRRTAFRAGGAGLAVSALGAGSAAASAQEATPEPADADKTFFLFVQTARSGSFTPNPGAGTPTVDGTPEAGGGADYLLTLEGHAGGTVYFSDRPARIFGEAPTDAFLDGLGFSPDNPPNAALVTQAVDGADEVVILELLDPVYDASSGTVTYGATILDEYTGEGLAHVAGRQQEAALPDTFGRASLFIDDCASQIVQCISLDSGDDVGDFPAYTSFCWYNNYYACCPCETAERDDWDQRCNATFPECDANCRSVIPSGQCW